MFRNISVTELLIILLILLVVFGAGRVGELGGALGKAIREFRRELTGGGEEKERREPDEQEKDW
jgi:sec-independent protein translocase protein TatA